MQLIQRAEVLILRGLCALFGGILRVLNHFWPDPPEPEGPVGYFLASAPRNMHPKDFKRLAARRRMVRRG